MINVLGKVTKDLEFSHECYGEKFYKTELQVFRTSGTFDLLPVIVSEKITNCLFKDDYISVEGEIRTHNDFGHLIVSIFAEQINLINLSTDNNRIDYNSVELDGYICKKSKIRDTPGGRVICDFITATNRPYGKSDYMPCIAWSRNARFVDKLAIGTKVNIVGRLQSRTYIKDNKEYTTYEVSIQGISEK